MSETRITDPKTGGQKGQKEERYDLIPFDALDEIARVYGFGSRKYAPNNWLKGYAWSLSLGALCRHVSLFAQGEDRDPETGRLHIAHAAFHCLALITFYLRGLGTDDREKAPGNEPIQYTPIQYPPTDFPTWDWPDEEPKKKAKGRPR